MKKNLLLCWLFLTTSIFLTNGQTYNLGEFYKNYQRITVRDGNRVLDQEGGQYDGNVYAGSWHGGNNQQWVVMPMYIRADQGDVRISRDHIIASRHDGKVLDVSGSDNVYCHPNFHGGNNQIFNLNSRPSNFFEVTSPHNTSKVFDKSRSSRNKNPFKQPSRHRDNIYFGGLHGGNNQQFRFNNEASLPNQIRTIRYRRTQEIPFPPNPKGLYTTENNETPEVFYSETLIPFPLVKNDLPPSAQVTRSPYYRLQRTQFWKKPGISGPADEQPDQIFIVGDQTERTIRVKTGVKISESNETFRKLNVGFTSSQEVGGKLTEAITAKMTTSLSLGLELSQKQINSKEDTYERTEELKTTFVAQETMRVIHYVKVDRYRLFRADGTEIQRWDVNTNLKHIATFPEAEVEGNPNGRTFRIRSKSGNSNTKTYNICWKDLVGVTANGNTLKKTNTTSWWNSGAASQGKLPAGKDGWIEMTATETNTYRMFGLSQSNANATWDSIEHNFYLRIGGQIQIYEKGVFKTSGGTYKIGDKIRVERSGNKILYKKNGTVIYSSTTNPNVSLMADVSLYTPNATITNAVATFSCSSTGKQSDLVVQNVTPVEKTQSENKPSLDMKIYPNPSDGIYTLDFAKNAQVSSIEVYNVIGKLVYSKRMNRFEELKQIRINLSSQPNGVFFLKTEDKNGKITTKRLIKQ